MKTANMARGHHVRADEKLRLEPTALPTRLCRTRAGLLGWHPIGLVVA